MKRGIEFEETGLTGPVRLLSRRECKRTLQQLAGSPPPLVWKKGHAVVSPAFYELAMHPTILEVVRELIGDDVLLWGAKLVVRAPGKEHRWHTDVEGITGPGRTIAVWIGLENTNARSSMRFVTHSHRLDTFQQVSLDQGVGRQRATNEELLRWARKTERRCRVEQPAVRNGEAIFFAGGIWHGSVNTNWWGVRTAALLQYSTPDCPIRVPDSKDEYAWPAHFMEHPRPPCLLVSGRDRFDVNEILPETLIKSPVARTAASLDSDPLWPSWIRSLELLPLGRHDAPGVVVFPLYRGSTPALEHFSVELDVLGSLKRAAARSTPEEELLIVFSGKIEVVSDGSDPDPDVARTALVAGTILYRPASSGLFEIANPGPKEASYLSVRWRSTEAVDRAKMLPLSVFQYPLAGEQPSTSGEPSRTEIVDATTASLSCLRCRVVTFFPGATESLDDASCDRLLVLLDGTIELEGLDRIVNARSVLYAAAARPMLARCVGESPARCLVFDLLGGQHEPRIERDTPTLRNTLRSRPVAVLRKRLRAAWASLQARGAGG